MKINWVFAICRFIIYPSVQSSVLQPYQVITLVHYWKALGWKRVAFEDTLGNESASSIFKKSSQESVQLSTVRAFHNVTNTSLVYFMNQQSSSLSEISNFLQKRRQLPKMIVSSEIDFGTISFSSINISSEFFLVTYNDQFMYFNRCQTFVNDMIFASNAWNLFYSGGDVYHFYEQFDLQNARLRFIANDAP